MVKCLKRLEEQARTGHITLLQRGMKKGSAGWRAVGCMASMATRACGQGRARTAARCSLGSQIKRVMLLLVVVWFRVWCCAVPVGLVPRMVGKWVRLRQQSGEV